MNQALHRCPLFAFSLFAVFPLVLTCGCGKPPAPAEEEEHRAPVKVASAEKASFGEWTDLFGTTMTLPGGVATVSTLVEGRVVWLLGRSADKAGEQSAKTGRGDRPPVDEGQPVTEGQVLVRLDASLAQSHRDRMQLMLKDFEEKKQQAELAVKLAQMEVSRLKKLMKGESGPVISPLDLDKAEIALQDARSKQRGVAIQEETTQEELKSLNEQLAYYTLRAPLSGRLGLVQARLGQTLSIGAAVADVIDLSEIDVLCYAPPHVAARLAVGQPARLEGAEGEKTPEGRVAFIALAAQAETGNLAVKVRFPNPESRLRASTVQRVQVLTAAAAERWCIPEDAVMEDQDPPGVVVAGDLETKTKDGKSETVGKAHLLKVKLGVRDPDHHRVEILELFDPEKKTKQPVAEAKFVVEGGHGLQDDDLVKLEEEKEEKKEEK